MKFDLKLPPKQKLIVQPPADMVVGDAAMCHYTWGSIWSAMNGTKLWSFDKRFYTDANLELQARSTHTHMCTEAYDFWRQPRLPLQFPNTEPWARCCP